MNTEPEIEQDLNILVQKEFGCTPEGDSHSKIPGARINPSKIEKLSEIFSQFSETGNLNNILNEESQDRNSIERNAKSAVYGTLVHNLKYFTDIFKKTSYLERIPCERDFRAVFINKKDEYYDALQRIMDITIDEGLTNNPLLNAYRFWDTWRRNGQDFIPKKHKNFLISPDKIQYLWENHTIPREDIDLFISNHNEEIDKDIPFTANETFLLLNVYFPTCNLQIPTYIDKIEINKDSNKPIKIVDYKTGKQFKEPEFREKVQIFLMTLAVFTTLIDRTGDIDYSVSDWDIMHSKNNIPLPRFKENSKIFKTGFLGSIHSEDIIEIGNLIKNNINFSYINPITKEEIEIDLNNVFFKNTAETENILNYLNRLTDFYIQNKNILKAKLSSRNAPYTLPVFPKEGFLKDSYAQSSVQLSLNI